MEVVIAVAVVVKIKISGMALSAFVELSGLTQLLLTIFSHFFALFDA